MRKIGNEYVEDITNIFAGLSRSNGMAITTFMRELREAEEAFRSNPKKPIKGVVTIDHSDGGMFGQHITLRAKAR